MGFKSLSSEEIATCMKVISDPTRLLMLKLVSKKKYCVCQFVDMFNASQPSISQHLKKLKEAGLVVETRKGQWRFYSLNQSSPKADLIQGVLKQLSDQDERYRSLIEKESPVDCG
ncbi:ArsR/SmtB family transcription factor [Shouchella clausii]|uniref:ArsR/SmtB family transcription factor n=1 Tax=Shouchella clausii TaxID=79880 RepID=UPI000BA59178|nr:metalloregulator ArsR/SmtB family transcription factor [Shouchella clausii]PAD16004.1 transcriptional regulator [Shouchella clausii]GIN08725.1 HTH-type transcriptional repressor AseR [Shouchella clausii]